MATNISNQVKANASQDYKIDGRVTLNVPLKPVSYDRNFERDQAISGVRVNADQWPSSSGT